MAKQAYRRRKLNEKEQEKKFYETFPSRFEGMKCAEAIIEVFKTPEVYKYIPEIEDCRLIAHNFINLIGYIRANEGARSQFWSTLIERCFTGFQHPAAVARRYLGMSYKHFQSAITHSKLSNNLLMLKNSKKKVIDRKSHVSQLEEYFIRKWALGCCAPNGESSTRRVHCDLGRTGLYTKYAEHGHIEVYAELAETPDFAERVASYQLESRKEKQEKESLVRSLYYAKWWKENKFEGERPKQILPRCRQAFWAAINRRMSRSEQISFLLIQEEIERYIQQEKKKVGVDSDHSQDVFKFDVSSLEMTFWDVPGVNAPPKDFLQKVDHRIKNKEISLKKPFEGGTKKFLPILYSRMIHPCPLCLDAPDNLQDLEMLTNVMENPSLQEDEKQSVKERLREVHDKIEELKDHKDKYLSQRQELIRLEADLKHHPGVVIVYEDFGSKGHKGGSKQKMSDLILTLVYWNFETKQKDKKFYHSFTKGSMSPENLNDPSKYGKQDMFVYRQTWLNWFAKGIFRPFHTIIKSGDNGASLKNYRILYMFGKISVEYGKRILFFTLCNYHAWNRCDPEGGRIVEIIRKEERKRDCTIDTAEEHVQVVMDRKKKNPLQFQNTVDCQALHVMSNFDDWMPESICVNSDKVFGIRGSCIVYPETPSIFDQQREPKITIRRRGLFLEGSNFADKKVGYLDLRPELADRANWCMDCTITFDRVVLISEHDLEDYWLCPMTLIYSYETKNSLYDICTYCKSRVVDAHKQGTKNQCPSKARPKILPQKFPALTIHGLPHETLDIVYEKQELTQVDIINTVNYYSKKKPRAEDKGPEKLIEGMMIIFQTQDELAKVAPNIPWGVGVCTRSNPQRKTYTIRVYKNVHEKERSGVWNMIFVEGEEELDIKFTCPWLPLRLKGNRIPTRTIRAVLNDQRFKWDMFAAEDETEIDKIEELSETEEN